MRRFILALAYAAVGGCAPTGISPQPYSDAEWETVLVKAQSDCFAREVKAISEIKTDLNSAALTVRARCAPETEQFKAFLARKTTEGGSAFEGRMRRYADDDLRTIEQMLVLVRTKKN